LAGPAFVRALGVLLAGDTAPAEASRERTSVPQEHFEE
jgi:hypothetical protein